MTFSYLRSIKSDATFNQDVVHSFVARMSEEGKPLYSYDLSAATDRLPLEVQEASLQILFGKQVSTSW